MIRYFLNAVMVILILILSSCSSSKKIEKEEKTEEVKPVEEIKAPPKQEEKYDILERSIFSHSSLSFDVKDSNVYEDPVVGEFIKLKTGEKYSIIFHQFDYDKETNEKDREIVFAFELPILEKGIKLYPEKFIYYLLSYSGNKSRIDGKAIHGFVSFKDINTDYVTGFFDFSIEGNKKSFDQQDILVDVKYAGSFKLPLNDLNSKIK